MGTLKEIAEKVDVSSATISRVLNKDKKIQKKYKIGVVFSHSEKV